MALKRVDNWGELFDSPESWAFGDDGTVWVSCDRGHVARIPKHDISDAGVVTPSILLVTPLPDDAECRWHVMATLRDYEASITS